MSALLLSLKGSMVDRLRKLQTRILQSVVTNMNLIATGATLPPLEVVKFSGDPSEFFKFKARFHQMVDSQNLSDSQKMSRLLQFLEGKARKAVEGFEGMPGGVRKAVRLLEVRFGQPHMIVKACVDGLIEGPNISNSDKEGLREFADRSRTLYETLVAMNALSEMNLTNLGKMAGKLPTAHQAKWRDEAQRIRERGTLPSFKDLLEFIEKRADAINDPIFGRIGETSRAPIKPGRKNPKVPSAPGAEGKVTTLATQLTSGSPQQKDPRNTGRSAKCMNYQESHYLEDCGKFKKLTLRQRKIFVRGRGLCLNCLRKGHLVTQCVFKSKCNLCSQKHHVLLHNAASDCVDSPCQSQEQVSASVMTGDGRTSGSPSQNHDQVKVSANVMTAESGTSSVPTFDQAASGIATVSVVNFAKSASYKACSQTAFKSHKVALQVVPVRLEGENGQTVNTWALLDTGSEDSFIAKPTADQLSLRIKSFESLVVCTLTGETTVRVGKVDLVVLPIEDSEGHRIQIHDVKVVENLNVSSSRPQDLSKWEHLNGIAMPEIDEEEVTLLIGANVPEVQIHEEVRVGRAGEPYAVRTLLGWSILGPLNSSIGITSDKVNVNFLKYGSQMLDQQMNHFLGFENIECISSSKKGMSVEDRESLHKLNSSVRLVDGRYEVRMLWKYENPWLPNNKMTAEARLRSLKRKLCKEEQLLCKYRDFMDDLLVKGYARKLTEVEAEARSPRTWYLPHHGVFHPQKPGKIRVVFDAAANHDGVSLNSQLNRGPDLTNSLFGVLLRFRQERIALVADIQSMFLQVKVPAEDADALRFLWWEEGDLNRPPGEYQMVRHIFGAKDSPSCVNFCLKRTAEDNKNDFSEEAVRAVQEDFYVDDLLKAVETTSKAISLAHELMSLLERGGFRLTKWTSNSRELLANIPEDKRAQPTLNLDLDQLPIERALAVLWNIETDVFQFKVLKPDKPATKRGILSTISSLYDPVGFVCPVVLEAKKIIQRLWKLQLDWDDPVPEFELAHWERWKSELSALSQVQIPRCYLQLQGEVKEISLHQYSDASDEGYGMCSYLRFVYEDGSIQCSFLVGKSKTMPVRAISIPRLELQAATLSAKIYQVCRDELTYKIDRVVFWTDSQTTLQYIKNETKRFNTYVANRIAEIREITRPDQWRHCPGRLNPADDASRGLKPKRLSSQHRWWKGPEYLWQSENNWPKTEIGEVPHDDPEVRNEAQIHSIRTVNPHAESFAEELRDLKAGREVKTSSKLVKLKPVLTEGILRVGGRLEEAVVLSYNERHPVILPRNHHISQLIVRHCHESLAHAGKEQTLAQTRKMFWRQRFSKEHH
ncbi:hypothetical protein ACROYT_G013221 [Oculina patagonica]